MKIGTELLYLSARDVEAVGLTIAECMALLEQAHVARSEGRTEMPAKPMLGNPAQEGFLLGYPARIADAGQVGLKWLGGSRHNAAKGLPAITGLIVVNDPQTFCPVAVMDCRWITGLRTAAVSGIALRHLSRADSETIAILGCGLQGRTHLEAAVSVRPGLKRVLAWGPRPQTASRFVAQMRAQQPQLEYSCTEDARAAVQASDIVVSSTPFGDPDSFRLIHADWIRPGVTVIDISLAGHLHPDGFDAFDRCVVDDRGTLELIGRRTGFAHAPAHAYVELGAVLRAKAPGRRSADESILMLAEGIAINDIPTAHRIYQRALERGIGTILPL